MQVSLSKLIQAVDVVRLFSGFDVCMLGILVAHRFSFLVLAVIMSMENAAQGHTTVEEEEAVMKNL
jgi:hypothetical protein